MQQHFTSSKGFLERSSHSVAHTRCGDLHHGWISTADIVTAGIIAADITPADTITIVDIIAAEVIVADKDGSYFT